MYLLCIWNGEVILPKMALSCSKKVVSVELTLKSGLRWTYGIEWKVAYIVAIPEQCLKFAFSKKATKID